MSPSRSSVQRSAADEIEEADRWLADLLDWLDAQQVPPSNSTDAGCLLQQFFAAQARSLPTATVQQTLLEFIAGSVAVAGVAAHAALDWIETYQPDPVEQLPVEFGDYTLLQVIGRGGMGIVYRATQRSLERTVCIKKTQLGRQPQAQLVREAKLAAALQHPNIVNIYDVGVSGDQSYIAMELVEGQSLAACLTDGPLAARDAASLMLPICDAIHFAHTQGILHRDLKPANVLLDCDDRPRVTDFGLAKRLQQAVGSSADTLTGIAGSPSYMAPEQVRNSSLTARTDVYGLGAILYEMLAGRPPVVGTSVIETLRLVETTVPVELNRLHVGLPKDLETICRKCLEKRAVDRYDSVEALSEDLQRFLRNEPVRARPVGPSVRLLRWIRRNRMASAAMASIAASILASIVGLSWMLSETQQALTRTRVAEAAQRHLASDLKVAAATTTDALYRSLITQATLALQANEVVAARRSLQLIIRQQSLARQARIEFDLLRERAWPGTGLLLPNDRRIVHLDWVAATAELLAVDAAGSVLLFNTRDSEVLWSVPQPFEAVTQLAAHPRHRVAALISAGQVKLLDMDQQSVAELPKLAETVRHIAWHPQAFMLMLSTVSGEVYSLDVEANQLRPLDVWPAPVRQVAFSADGKWLTALTQRDVRTLLWDTHRTASDAADPSPPLIAQLEADRWPVDATWSPDGNELLVLDATGRVTAFVKPTVGDGPDMQRSWRMETDVREVAALHLTDTLVVLTGEREAVGISPTIRTMLWRHPLPLHSKLRFAGSGSEDGDAVAEVRTPVALIDPSTKSIQLWDVQRLATVTQEETGAVPVRKVVMDRSGITQAWRDVDGRITVQVAARESPQSKAVRSTFAESTQPGTGLALSPTGDRLLTARDRSVVLYRLPTIQQIMQLKHDATVWCVCMSPDGSLVAFGDSNGRLQVFQTDGGRRLQSFDNLQTNVRSVAFTSDGRQLLAVDDSARVRLCDVISGRLVNISLLKSTTATCVATGPANFAVTGDVNGRLTLLNVQGQRCVSDFAAHDGPVWSLVVTADRIISAGQDGTVQIRNLDGQLLLTAARLPEPIWSIQLAEDAGRLLGSTTHGTIFSLSWSPL